jgi:hypothetical protein
VRRRVVDEVAVLDGTHAELQTSVDRDNGVGMRGDVALGRGGFLDDCADLVVAELVEAMRSVGEATPPDAMILM